MAKRIGLVLAGLLFATFSVAGCSGDDAPLDVPQSVPTDFALTYSWREGSLPPPHHYEYTITLDHDGRGEVVLVPDYSFNSPPEWRETFSLTAAELQAVYLSLVRHGLFSTDWRTEDNGAAGGALDSIEAVAGGRKVDVRSPLKRSQDDDWDELAEEVHDIVPRATWEKLMGLRDQYVSEHPR